MWPWFDAETLRFQRGSRKLPGGMICRAYCNKSMLPHMAVVIKELKIL